MTRHIHYRSNVVVFFKVMSIFKQKWIKMIGHTLQGSIS